MLKKTFAALLSLIMTMAVLLPGQLMTAFAEEAPQAAAEETPQAAAEETPAAETAVIVDDTVTDQTKKHYFTYTAATDKNGETGWAADRKPTIEGDENAKTQHWVWNNKSHAEAAKHTYTFTFTGTGVELVGVKNDSVNVFQMDEEKAVPTTINGEKDTPIVIYSKKDLKFGQHTVKATLPENSGTGLQVCYAKVYGSGDPVEPEVKPEGLKLEIPHNKQEGETNKFTYSKDWTISNAHSWSNKGTKDEIWYQVDFVGNAIEVYSGKNNPMGIVEYFIDDKSMGEFSLFHNGNIDETYITTFAGLKEGPHKFKAVATGKRDKESTNSLIDAAKVVVYHKPYEVKKLTCAQKELNLKEWQSQKLELTTEPSYISVEELTFTSDKEEVATVSKDGTVTAGRKGTANITVTPKTGSAAALTIPVTVTEATPNLGGSVVDVDTQYTQNRYEEVKGMTKRTETLTAWKNDTAISEIALVSKDCGLRNVTITAEELVEKDGVSKIPASNIKTTFIKSTQAYSGGYPGYGSLTRPIPQGNRQESSDILYQTTPMDMGYNVVQPVWVSIKVPKDAKAGTYTTNISVTAEGLKTPLTFTYTLTVQDATLKDATEFKDSFDIELWQYPYSSAEYYDVTPFSKEHLDILRPQMELYRDMGGHAITATIIEDAWDGQTYSAKDIHYPSMIKWKKVNGEMTYDYTDFDAWVNFNKELGIGDKIVLYSVAPWHMNFTYWENDKLVKKPMHPGSTEYKEMWTHFLKDLMKHVTDKGWFDQCYIGIDERGFRAEPFNVIESVKNEKGECFKTAGAINDYNAHHDIAMRVTDVNVGDNCVVGKNEASFNQFLADRKAKNLRTTLYTCTEHHPGNFSLSAPVESYWSVINAGEKTAGMLRWAYDAWVADPLRDTTHNAFEPGDCFLVYPDEKGVANPQPKSSVRLERMAQGVRDVNKLRQMMAEFPVMKQDVDTLYNKVKTVPQINHNFLNATQVQALRNEMDTFRAGIDTLTNRYVHLRDHGTDKVESITIVGGDVTLVEKETRQLEAALTPAGLVNTNVTWSSSDANIASVNETGLLTANKEGTATITATSVQDTTKTATIRVTVKQGLSLQNTLTEYQMPDKYLMDLEKAPNTPRQYLGQPDMICTRTGRLITAYPIGHGHGPLVMRISDDNGATWTEKTDLPKSWEKSQETPTLYTLDMPDGHERLMLITACPNWDLKKGGWDTAYSDDNGETWTELKNWHPNLPNGNKNFSIVGMASLVQLKDRTTGEYIPKWMGVYHDYGYVNYKTYLTFDQDGNEQWSAPVPYLSQYRDIESKNQLCEIGMFRSPDGNRIVGLARNQSHNGPAMMIYSDDEGKTWSCPTALPGSLAGERHKAVYDPVSGRMMIFFRQIKYDLNNNGKYDGGDDWHCGSWMMWVGTYEQLMNREDGDYCVTVSQDYSQNHYGGDTGYTGVCVLADGTVVADSYGHFDEAFSKKHGSDVRTDLCYIRQAKFKLSDLDREFGIQAK